MDWSKLIKSKKDVKKIIRGATGQKEPTEYKNDDSELGRKIQAANDAKKAEAASEKDFYDKQWSDEDIKRESLKNIRKRKQQRLQ